MPPFSVVPSLDSRRSLSFRWGCLPGCHLYGGLVAVTGNLLTVGLAAVFGQRLRIRWTARRRARGETAAESENPAKLERRNRRQARFDRVMDRWGMLGLALLGPIGLGTQLSALAAVARGVPAREAIARVGTGTLAWSVVAAVLTVSGVSTSGIGT